MQDIIPIAIVRERERDPETMRQAQARTDAARARLAPHGDHMNALARNAMREPDMTRKFGLLRDLARFVEIGVGAVAACRQGCSHCCNIPLLLTHAEARVIANETGRTMTTPRKYSHKSNLAYIGTPCPFLVGGACSIYDARPMACRLHYNLDADDLLCRLRPGESVQVPYFNNMQFMRVTLESVGGARMARLADVRDFFKRGD